MQRSRIKAASDGLGGFRRSKELQDRSTAIVPTNATVATTRDVERPGQCCSNNWFVQSSEDWCST